MSDGTPSPELVELARRNGVDAEFSDWQGRSRPIPAQTLVRVLGALGWDAATPEAIAASLAETEVRPWRRTLPPSLVARRGDPKVFPVHVPHGAPVRVDLLLEDGTRRSVEQVQIWTDPRPVDGRLTGRASFRLPEELPLGWHRLEARIGEPGRQAPPGLEAEPDASARCIVVPASIGHLLPETREWGLMAQLYQLRSRDSWGIGDLADLAATAEWGAARGAAFALVNPLHAPDPVPPIEPSPYLPSSRRFVDPNMLRIQELPGLHRLEPAEAERLARLHREAAAAGGPDAIDRDAVWAAKREALELVFAADLRDPERRRSFRAFCEREGRGLDDFAVYCVLCERHGTDRAAWPPQLRDPASPAVAAEREREAERADFFRWLQWSLDEQLAGVQARARAAGMRYGVVHDLAVGVHPGGADAWMLPDALARGVSVGAPPDMFNQLGQDWSQPPWRPERLAELGYAPYRDMLRSVLRHAGGLRVDHVIGLFRLWWIPEGMRPQDGAYVRYDAEAMLGVLLLEAERAGAVVIGEDLGVVEPGARETMRERGVAGTSVLWFEWRDGRPLAPEEYREPCLATVTTHDLPPTAGYLALEHVELRDRLGLLTVPAAEEREREAGTVAAMRAALVERGLIAPEADVEATVAAMHAWLADSRALLLGVSLADLAGDRRPVNQPGTFREYPNWSLPLAAPDGRPLRLEELLASPTAARVAAAAARPGS